jgi:hypothetical protein
MLQERQLGNPQNGMEERNNTQGRHTISPSSLFQEEEVR